MTGLIFWKDMVSVDVLQELCTVAFFVHNISIYCALYLLSKIAFAPLCCEKKNILNIKSAKVSILREESLTPLPFQSFSKFTMIVTF